MNPQEKELLEKTLEYTRENNKMLRAMRRSIRFSSFLRVAYWLIIIGLGIGLYQYLQPFLEEFKDVFNQAVELKNSFGNSS